MLAEVEEPCLHVVVLVDPALVVLVAVALQAIQVQLPELTASAEEAVAGAMLEEALAENPAEVA